MNTSFFVVAETYFFKVYSKLLKNYESVREASLKLTQGVFGYYPNWGVGGLNACQDGLWHLFGEELSKFKWAFACFSLETV